MSVDGKRLSQQSALKMTGSLLSKNAQMMPRAHSTLEYGRPTASANVTASNTLRDNPYGTLEVADMLKREAKAQFDGNVPKYPVPDTGPMMYRIYGQTQWKDSKTKRSTYIDKIFEGIKKDKYKSLGPSSYKADKSYDAATLRNYKRFQWNKEPRKSVIDDVQKREKNMKGPADYKPDKKKKVKGNYLLNERAGQFMDEIEFTANQSPGSNHYKQINEGQSSLKPRASNANLNRDRSPKDSIFDAKGEKDKPGPASYKGIDNNWKRMSPYKNTIPNFTIPKNKYESFIDVHTKQKSKVPALSKNLDEIKVLDKISKGYVPHFKRGR